MKPPVTVEAKVAKELRTWLASELEQLEASNTNQFAHHVVTILLHEDLAIEDEPLTANDDFIKDIYNIRQGKTKLSQKKSAVQFLREAVCCEVQVAEIQGVVDELMVKIENTKAKMNNRKENKKNSLALAPIAVNVDTPVRKTCTKSDSDEDRYHEAFPSLSGGNSPCKDGGSLRKGHNSIWNGFESGKENVGLRRHRGFRTSGKPLQTPFFCSTTESRTSNLARRVAAAVLEEPCLPLPHTSEFSRRARKTSLSLSEEKCWNSAFSPSSSYMTLFMPNKTKLTSPEPSEVKQPQIFSPFVIHKEGDTNENLNEGYSDEEKETLSLLLTKPLIKRHKQSANEMLLSPGAFPEEYKYFWPKLQLGGSGKSGANSTATNVDGSVKPNTGCPIEKWTKSTDLEPAPSYRYNCFLESSKSWNAIRVSFLNDVRHINHKEHSSHVQRFFRPSQLTMMLRSEDDQLLQSAFINSMFAANSFPNSVTNDDISVIACAGWAPSCNDVEDYLFSSSSCLCACHDVQSNVVKGSTCSHWLENRCSLGDACPYSHPSI